jgi:hypothetical protein
MLRELFRRAQAISWRVAETFGNGGEFLVIAG